MSTEHAWHTIAVGNSLLGVYNFLVLATPADWRIVVMPMASDVFSHTSVNGAKWVRDGEVKHFIKAGRRFYDLEIRVRPGRRTRALGDAAELGGHEARYYVKEVGLLRRRKALVVEAYCPATDRTIELAIKGDSAPLELLAYLKHSKCH